MSKPERPVYDPNAEWFIYDGRKWPNDHDGWVRYYLAIKDSDFAFSMAELEEKEARDAWEKAKVAWRRRQRRLQRAAAETGEQSTPGGATKRDPKSK